MRVEQTFTISRPPEVVFDYVANPANLASWQTANTLVEQLTEGQPRLGSRYRERVKPTMGKQFDQVVEFADFERPHRLRVHVVEGPYPIDGAWTFEPVDAGTSVSFVADGELTGPLKLLEPLARRALARQFRDYHRNLTRELEHR